MKKSLWVCVTAAVLATAFVYVRFGSDHPIPAPVPSESLAQSTLYFQENLPELVELKHDIKAKMSAKEIADVLNKTSLFNTDPPGIPRLDANGNLVVNSGFRDLLDYFLALRGELSRADIRALAANFFELHLQGEALQKALTLYDQYAEFFSQLAVLEINSDGIENLQERLQQKIDLRRKYLGDELADAFFGDEEAYDEFSLKRVELNRSELDASQREEAMESAMASLPPEMLVRKEQIEQQEQMMEETRKLKKAGASSAEIYQYQLLQGNVDIAERYQALSLQRQAWSQRYLDYRDRLKTIENGSANPQEQASAIIQLQGEAFSEEERLRVKSLDQLDTNARKSLLGG